MTRQPASSRTKNNNHRVLSRFRHPDASRQPQPFSTDSNLMRLARPIQLAACSTEGRTSSLRPDRRRNNQNEARSARQIQAVLCAPTPFQAGKHRQEKQNKRERDKKAKHSINLLNPLKERLVRSIRFWCARKTVLL